MPGNNTSNTSPVIKAEVYSELMLETLKEGFLPEGLFRDVNDFGDGDTLNIPTLGEMTLFDLVEDEDTPTSALDTGNIILNITEHVGVAGYVSDKLKEDAYKAAAVEAQIPKSSLRSVKERFETDLLATSISTSNGIVTLGDVNAINGHDHRWISATAGNIISLADFVQIKLSLDKARVPSEGRIMICDAVVEATINSLSNLLNVSNNPMFEGMVTTGFAKNRKFVKNIFGIDIWVSDMLPRIASESIAGSQIGAASITGGVNNIVISVADDSTTPFMGAMRRQPRVEAHRNTSKRRDEYHTTARWGFGLQRGESLVSVITSATNY